MNNKPYSGNATFIKVLIMVLIVGMATFNILSNFNLWPLKREVRDKDLDGFISEEYGGKDCNDSESSINPSAKDVPDDGIDQDCTGGDATLKNLTPNENFDGDEYTIDNDCDDTSPLTYPGAEELFDFRDNDCDGFIDEGFKALVLYEDFVIPSYEPDVVIGTARQLETNGNVSDLYLYVEAGVDTPERQLTQYDSIYVFVDNINDDGHLIREESLMGDSVSRGDTTTKLLFGMEEVPLTGIPYPNGRWTRDFTGMLNVPGIHRLGSFVATQRSGVLKKLVLGYRTGEITLVK